MKKTAIKAGISGVLLMACSHLQAQALARNPADGASLDLRTPAVTLTDAALIEFPPAGSLFRDFRRNGIPLAVLWDSPQVRVAAGISPRKVAGLYFVRKFDSDR